MVLTKEKLLFLLLFIFVGFFSLQIPVNKLAGSNVSFTLFDFFGPIAGAFIGPVFGVISVLLVEVFTIFVRHTPLTTGAIVRLFPTLFAAYYFAVFSKKEKQNAFILLVPIIAILLFIANPIGRTVWYYSMFWLIPLIAYFKRNMVFIRSLGATFTAHAVGGAAWIWTFHLPSSVWKGLIPVVIEERLLFGLGIAVSYFAMRYILKFLISKKLLPKLDTLQPAV